MSFFPDRRCPEPRPLYLALAPPTPLRLAIVFLLVTLVFGAHPRATTAQRTPHLPAAAQPAPQPAPPSAPAAAHDAPAAPPPAAPSPADPAEARRRLLDDRLRELLRDPALRGAHIGVLVVEAESGRTLFAQRERDLLNIASNVKLITTAAALTRLGPEYRFRTALYSAVPPRGGELGGDLYVKGMGDPSLATEHLWKLADALYVAGVRQVKGGVVVDDTYFDRVRFGPRFADGQDDAYFRAPNGAAALNFSTAVLTVRPGAGSKDGGRARITVDPASPYVSVVNEVSTARTGHTELGVATAARDATTEVRVFGRIVRRDAGRKLRVRIHHPELYLGHSLREVLGRRGIKLLAKRVSVAAAPADAHLLTIHLSDPLAVLVRDVNKLSNNFMAEQLLKTLGAESAGIPGTWQKGIAALAHYLGELGIAAGSYRLENGSGLYDSNRFSALQVVTLLRAVFRDFRIAADFLASLAMAGADGTIGRRMGEPALLSGQVSSRFVRAKTGTLRSVSCLSGFAGGVGQPPVVFAILINNLAPEGRARAQQLQDEMAAAMVQYVGLK